MTATSLAGLGSQALAPRNARAAQFAQPSFRKRRFPNPSGWSYDQAHQSSVESEIIDTAPYILDSNRQADAEPHSEGPAIAIGTRIPAEAMRTIERKVQLDHFKWDTQVGDSSVLSPQALLMAEKEWGWLSKKAEKAAEEMYAFEREIACSPILQ